MKKGKLLIFSAPSGAGKSTLVNHLVANNKNLDFSISCATRPKRKGEIHGKHYHFLSPEEFKQKVSEGAFVEWEEVYPNQFYGTLRSEIERLWAEGKHVLFDIDVVGGLNLKKIYDGQALTVFVQPPSIEELGKRLTARNTETPDKLKMRIDKAAEEIECANRFDKIIINDDLNKAKKEIQEVVEEFIKQ